MALLLAVDDEADICELLRISLELAGHEVMVAHDGVQALAAVAGGARPDLILLDVMMPGLDGWEVLRRLKADPDPDVASTPVVFLTARAAEIDRIRGGIEGAVRYLTKPFSMNVLAEVVEAAIEADEADARHAAQTSALAHLARLERGVVALPDDGSRPPETHEPGVRFSRLERRPDRPVPGVPARLAYDVAGLSAKQRAVLHAVGLHPTVRVAAASMGVSRANVYASLRRIASRLEVDSVHELVVLAREWAI